MQLTEFPGGAYLQTTNRRILFGPFSEVHQHIQKAGLAFPDIVVCSDVRMQAGVPQLVPEFLFFGHLFIEGNFDSQEHRVKAPLTFVGSPEQCAAVRRIMEVSYLGASSDVLGAVDLPPETLEMLRHEGDYFALKDAQQNILPIDAYLRFLHWQDESLNLDGLRIEKLGASRFRVQEGSQEILVDIAFEGAQDPVWPLPEVDEVLTDHPFSLMVLGAAGPFQTEAPSSSYLLTLNEEYYLIDCAPYTHRILERLGISTEQIRGIFLTHVHDDHSGGLPAFLQQNEKIELFSTREIHSAARIKSAALLGIAEEEIDRRLLFHEVRVGEPLKRGGVSLFFHYACHSIPTIGITVAADEERIALTGDTAGRRTLEEMLKKKVIDRKRFEDLTGLSMEKKVLVDCGEALIHGYPQDYLQVPDTRNIILAHRKDLPPEYEGIFTLAQSLQIFPLRVADPGAFDTALIGRTLSSWGLKDAEPWCALFAARHKVLECAKGTSLDEDFIFFVSHGLLGISVNGQEVARLKAGDTFGEQRLLGCSGNIRVEALSPVRLLAIPPECFQDLLEQEQGLFSKLRKKWEKQEILSRIKVFALSVPSPEFTLKPERISLAPNSALCGDPACYLICRGKLLLERGEERIFLKENQLFGDFDDPLEECGGIRIGGGRVEVLENTSLLKFSPHDLFRLRGDSAVILNTLEELLKK